MAIGYNPIMDFYDGTSTQYIDLRDVIYCIRYAGKVRRFVYNASLSCTAAGPLVSIHLLHPR